MVCDVWPSFADVATHLAHYADVIVAVEKVVLVFARARTPARAMGCLVCLESRIAKDDDQPLCVLVISGNRDMLLGDQSGQLWRRHRLCSYTRYRHVSPEAVRVKGNGTMPPGTKLSTYLRASFHVRMSLDPEKRVFLVTC